MAKVTIISKIINWVAFVGEFLGGIISNALLWDFVVVMGVLGFIVYVFRKDLDRGSLITGAAALLFVLVLITPFSDFLTPEYLTAVATVVLAVVTMTYVSITKKLVEHQSIEQRRPLMRSLSNEVILPSIETIRENKTALETGELIGWHQMTHPKGDESGQAGYTSLEVITHRTDRKPGTMLQFQDQFPEIYEKMEEHDSVLMKLDDKATELIHMLRYGGIETYIREHDLPVKDKPYIIIEAILSGPNPFTEQHNYYTIWQNHREEFSEVAEEAAGESLVEFFELKQEYLETSEELIDVLIEKRNEVQKNIGIE